MDEATYFERLAMNVRRIAHHSSFAAKREAVELCLEDIDDLRLAGRITAEQAGILRQTLRDTLGQAA